MRAIERRSNSVMAKLLAQLPPRVLPLNEKLSRYLMEGVVERNGFVLLNAEKDRVAVYDPVAHFDETGYECFVNHVHLDPKQDQDFSQLDVALVYADRLARVLEGSGYRGPFRIILSYGLDDRVFTVRFHRVRQGQSWLDDNLEGYKREGILVIEC